MPDKLKKIESNRLELLWINIAHLNKLNQFLLCTIFVFAFFLLYGYLQELIFTQKEFKAYGWYLTLFQFLCYTFLGSLEFYFTGFERRMPMSTYALLGFLTVGTMGFSNSSLKYLNYPTQVIFKCCKLIPVMVGGVLIQKIHYKIIDYAASLCMSIGLIFFTLADSHVSPNFNFMGIIMIMGALTCDAMIGNVQEKQMKRFSASNAEIIFFSYGVGLLYLFITLLIKGDLLDGFIFFSEQPTVYLNAAVFSLCGYLGLSIVLTLVRICGALTAVTVTTCRKAVTIIISFLCFEKPFTMHYLWAGFIILLGIYLSVLGKQKVDLADILRRLRRRPRKNASTVENPYVV